MTPGLSKLQTLLYRVITAAPGAAPGSDIGILPHVIRGDERLSALERVGIYVDAYFLSAPRLFEREFPSHGAD